MNCSAYPPYCSSVFPAFCAVDVCADDVILCDQVWQLSLFELPALNFDVDDVNLFKYHGNFFGNRRESKCPLLIANVPRILVTFQFFLPNFQKCEKKDLRPQNQLPLVQLQHQCHRHRGRADQKRGYRHQPFQLSPLWLGALRLRQR